MIFLLGLVFISENVLDEIERELIEVNWVNSHAFGMQAESSYFFELVIRMKNFGDKAYFESLTRKDHPTLRLAGHYCLAQLEHSCLELTQETNTFYRNQYVFFSPPGCTILKMKYIEVLLWMHQDHQVLGRIPVLNNKAKSALPPKRFWNFKTYAQRKAELK